MNYGRWLRNSVTTLTSKRGQAVLRELEEALLALPVKRLVKGELEAPASRYMPAGTPADHCVIGALASYKGVPIPALEKWDNEASYLSTWAAENLGLARTLAWNLMEQNDEGFDTDTPEKRYENTLFWVRKHIRKEVIQMTRETQREGVERESENVERETVREPADQPKPEEKPGQGTGSPAREGDKST